MQTSAHHWAGVGTREMYVWGGGQGRAEQLGGVQRKSVPGGEWRPQELWDTPQAGYWGRKENVPTLTAGQPVTLLYNVLHRQCILDEVHAVGGGGQEEEVEKRRKEGRDNLGWRLGRTCSVYCTSIRFQCFLSALYVKLPDVT